MSNVNANPLWDVMGPPGRDGRDGQSIKGDPGPKGKDGVDGSGYRWRGEFSRVATYAPNDTVEFEGSSYVCTRESKGRSPDSSKSFELMAKRGERGKPGESLPGQRGRSSLPMQMDMLARIEQLEASGGGAASVRMEAIFDSNTQAGEVVYISGDGHVDLAQANGEPQALAVGIAVADVLAGESGSYIPVGPVNCQTWNLIPGNVYYLDPDIAGGLTNVFPNTIGDRVAILGAAATPTQLNLEIHWALVIGS